MTDQRTCAHCSAPLTKPTQRRYCSHPCATQGQRTRPVRTVACPCGLTFTTTDPVQRYCGDDCRKALNAWKRDQVTCLPRAVDRAWRG